MSEAIRILMLEDVDSDAELIQHALRKSGLQFEARREATRAGFERALEDYEPDLILADFNLPDYTGARALRLARQRLPEVPVIMVTGNLGDEVAADLIKAGARDYVLKDRLARLGPAVHQALEDARERRWRIAQERARQQSEQRFSGLLDNVNLLAVMLDRDGQITYVNDFLLELTGWTRNGVIGHSWFEMFIPPGARDEIRRLFGGAINDTEPALHHENEILTRAGERRLIRWDNTMLYGPDGAITGTASLGADITDYRHASEQLRASEQRFRALIENATDIIAVLGPDGTVRYISPAIQSIAAYAPEALIGQHFLKLVHPDDQPHARRNLAEALNDAASVVSASYRIKHASGSWLTAKAVAVNRLATPGIEGVVVTFNDVTAIERAAAETRQAHKLLTTVVDAIPVRVFWKDRQLRYLGCNQAFAEDAGFSGPHDVTGKDDHDMPWKDQVQLYQADDAAVIESGQAQLLIEEPQTTPDGRSITLLTSKVPLFDDTGAVTGVIGTYMDITEHKQLQAHLDLARALIERSPAVLFRWQAREGWPVDYVTDNVDQWGYTAEDLLAGDPPYTALIHPEDMPRIAAEVERYTADGTDEFAQEYRIVTPDGEAIWVDDRTTVERGEDGAPMYFQGIVTDISARKRDEDSLRRVNRALRIVSSGNATMARARSEDELLQSMCELIVDIGEFPLAWVGYAEHDEQSTVRPVARAGTRENQRYVDELAIHWADTPRGQGPTGRAVRTGRLQIVGDISQDPDYAPWRDGATQHELRSSIALPLIDGDMTFGALNIYSREAEAFAEDEQRLLGELAGELAFGIRSLRARKTSERGQRALAASLESTVKTLGATVELRDPYTAGHQTRVAALAVAIGREMGLPEVSLTGMALAASIHDIGKLRIPAEILSKPGSLSSIEYKLIQGHSQAGRELLTGIEFPWPIADMIGQHHERLDGSGYPDGLKETDILLEAQIIAVADVTEAMSTHRPYRPALGEQAAIDELRRGRGTAFNPEVVDICVRLLESGEFQFGPPSAR